MKRFYVASGFSNIPNVRYVAQALEAKGYVNTYDWTQNAFGREAGPVTPATLRAIGQQEKDAVLSADVVVILLPGGKGTHVELGMAIAQGKRTILHSPDDVINNAETTSTFYHLPEVEKYCGPLDNLVDTIVGPWDDEGCKPDGSDCWISGTAPEWRIDRQLYIRTR